MIDFLLYILAGASVGLAIGLTGIGGGSLMTPILIFFGFPYNVAIGTDLLYASITKAGGMISHSSKDRRMAPSRPYGPWQFASIYNNCPTS